MTEAEWLCCTEPQMMLEFLGGRASERKLRLFSVACCWRVWNFLDGEVYRRGVEVATSYADGNATEEELVDAWRGARESYKQSFTRHHAGAAVVAAACPPQPPQGMPRHTRLLMAAIRAAWHAQDLGTGHPDDGERKAQAALVRDIFGNPLRPVTIDPGWLSGNDTVKRIGEAIYQDDRFDEMPILADALEEAGWPNADILGHCRHPGVHVRGCFVLDLLLGKELCL